MSNSRSENYNTKSPKKHKVWKVILIIFLILIILAAGVAAGAYIYVNNMLGKMNKETIDENAIGIDETTAESLKGYKNIALLGIDSREDDYGVGNRSDCIIIASINEDTKEVKLISVYRDTYLQLVENGKTTLDKVTHAYSYGTAQNTLLALNTNLDLNISQYITVNFDAVIAAVDAMDGVDIDIDSSELKYINSYIDATSQSSGVSSSHVTSTGTQTLDGVQAVAYSRIRYTAGGDYKRTERMRTVVQAMVAKAKKMSISKLNNLANIILPRVSTNISSNEILSLIPTLTSFNMNGSIGWPYTTKGITLDRWYGIPTTLESNVIKLHKEVFGETDYTLPDTIKNISDKIVKKTGYTEGEE